MDDDKGIEERLRAVGRRPVDGSVQAAHLTQIAGLAGRSRLSAKLRVAGVFLAGLLVGGSGLAVAGALPDQAQHLAHTALDRVGVDVPDPERYHGEECGPEKRNHGAYVRDDHDLAQYALHSPIKAGAEGKAEPKEAKGPCQGPPPWAGQDGSEMTPEQKAAAQAERADQCGDEDEVEAEAERQDAEPPPTTTTTSAPTTTTVATTTTGGETTTTGGS